MEEWEDDGWGVLESSVEPLRGRPTQTSELRTPATMSSGADFFDTFQTTSRTKSKGDDFFESFGATASGSKGRKERSPPPVSPTLFGGKKKEEEEEEGWGDWGGNFSSSSFSTRPAQVRAAYSSMYMYMNVINMSCVCIATKQEGGVNTVSWQGPQAGNKER